MKKLNVQKLTLCGVMAAVILLRFRKKLRMEKTA